MEISNTIIYYFYFFHPVGVFNGNVDFKKIKISFFKMLRRGQVLRNFSFSIRPATRYSSNTVNDEEEVEEIETTLIHSARRLLGFRFVPYGHASATTVMGIYQGSSQNSVVVFPPIIGRNVLVNTQEQTRHIKSLNCFTGDRQAITMDLSYVFRVMPDRIQDFFVTSSDPEKQLQIFLHQALLKQLRSRQTFHEVMGDIQESTEAILEEVTPQASRLGIQLERFAISDLKLPKAIQDAISTRFATEQKAQGEAFKAVKEAEAQAVVYVARARAMSEAREELARGLRDATQDLTNLGITPQDVQKFLLESERVQAMRSAADSGKLQVVQMNGSGPEMSAALHANLMKANQ